MKIIKTGCSRWVCLIGKYAIKFPNPTTKRSWLNGLLANMQEADFTTLKSDKLCPVLFSAWFGLLIVMPRCEPLTDTDFLNFAESQTTRENSITSAIFLMLDCGEFKQMIEYKTNSFGWLNGKIVALDYGN